MKLDSNDKRFKKLLTVWPYPSVYQTEILLSQNSSNLQCYSWNINIITPKILRNINSITSGIFISLLLKYWKILAVLLLKYLYYSPEILRNINSNTTEIFILYSLNIVKYQQYYFWNIYIILLKYWEISTLLIMKYLYNYSWNIDKYQLNFSWTKY